MLGYWGYRGFGQQIRLLLEHTGTEFEDRKFSGDDWFEVKYKMGFDFPNLPFYVDGDVKLTQPIAIMRHVCRNHGDASLLGKSEVERRRIDQLQEQCNDFRMIFCESICYNPHFEQIKEDFCSRHLPPMLAAYENFISSSEWFAGASLTYIDFVMYELLDWIRLFDQDAFAKNPHLAKFMERFETLPRVEAYMKSERFMKWPVFDQNASWGFNK